MSRRRMVTLSFRVSEEQAGVIRSLAREEGVSVSEYIRRRARNHAAQSSRPRLVRCRHTGAMIFAAPEGQPPLTTEEVREILGN